MVGFPGNYGQSPINLFRQHHPEQLMRKGQPGKRQFFDGHL
jgi:hypothetical protein